EVYPPREQQSVSAPQHGRRCGRRNDLLTTLDLDQEDALQMAEPPSSTVTPSRTPPGTTFHPQTNSRMSSSNCRRAARRSGNAHGAATAIVARPRSATGS